MGGGSDGADDDQPKQGGAQGLQRGVIRGEDYGAAGGHLQNHFHFAERRCRDDEAFHRRNFAQAHDHKFTADDDDHHPGLHQTHFNQRNECGGNQKFIGDGIEENSQRGYFFAFAGEVAVHHVGGGGDDQNQHPPNFKMNRQAQKIEIWLASEQDDDKQRNKKDAQGRQTIGQIH